MPFHLNSGVQSARMTALQNECHRLASLSINLKQWRVLQAVVACGSCAEAAGGLGMSQLAVSYSIAMMEEQLGTLLLQQEGTRAQLTETVAALLERASPLLRDAFDLQDYAANMRRG